MDRLAVLVPNAVLGRRYHVVVDDVPWVVVQIQVTHPEGMDAVNCTTLALAIGELAPENCLQFCPVAGMPVISAEWRHLLLPGGLMDATNVLALMVAGIEPEAVVEFRATGPDAGAVLDRVQAAIADINARRTL